MLIITNEGRSALRKTLGKRTAEVVIQAAFAVWKTDRTQAILTTSHGLPCVVATTSEKEMTESGIPAVTPGERQYYNWDASVMKWVKV